MTTHNMKTYLIKSSTIKYVKFSFALFFLSVINSSVIYLVYCYIVIASSLVEHNFLKIPFEPSGMQLSFFYLSLPVFLLVAALSEAHRYYFNLNQSLTNGIIVIWLAYFSLFFGVHWIEMLSARSTTLFWGSLFIAVVAIFYILKITYNQLKQFIWSNCKLNQSL